MTGSVDRTPSHNTFSRHFHPCAHQGVARRVCINHVHPHVITCLSVCCFLVLSSSSVSRASTFSLTSTCSLFWTSSRTPSIKPKAHPQNEDYCTVAIYNPLTCYVPKQFDNFDYSEASASIFQAETGDIDTELSYSCDAELDDELIGKALSSPLFIQVEKNQRTWDKLITLMKKVCCQLSPSSHAQVRGDPYTNQVQICLKNGNLVATQKTSESGFSLKDKKSKF